MTIGSGAAQDAGLVPDLIGACSAGAAAALGACRRLGPACAVIAAGAAMPIIAEAQHSLLAIEAPPAFASQAAQEAIAAAVMEAFVDSCATAAHDPAGFVAATTARPGHRQVRSPDNSILSLGYDLSPPATAPYEISVEVMFAAVGPDVLVIECGTMLLPLTQDFAAIDAAFRTVTDAMPAVIRAGGQMPYHAGFGEPGGVEFGSGFESFLYFLTGWSPHDPAMHVYAGIGVVGIDLWTSYQIQMEAPQ